MSRRRDQSPVWGPRLVPTARTRLVDTCAATVNELMHHQSVMREHLSTAGDLTPEQRASGADMLAWTRDLGGVTTRAQHAADSATMYWVTAGQARLAAAASQMQLPSWSPREVIPTPRGLMLFEEPLGTTLFGEDSVSVPLDGLLWGITDRALTVTTLSRLKKHGYLRDSWWPSNAVVYPIHHIERGMDLDDDADVSDVDRDGVLNVLAAIWLLMGQDRMSTVTSTRVRAATGADRSPNTTTASAGQDATVQVIDLHHSQPQATEHIDDPESAGRAYHHRWWVRGFWRQQPCGPNNSERRPTFIAPHVKGPEGQPFITKPERVIRV